KTEEEGYSQLLGNAAVTASRLHEYTRAEELGQRALDRFIALRGADHPDTATSRIILAEVYLETERTDEALAQLRAALAAYDASLPADHPSRIELLGLLADAHNAKGDLVAAEASLDAAEAIVDNDDVSPKDVGAHWGRRAHLAKQR